MNSSPVRHTPKEIPTRLVNKREREKQDRQSSSDIRLLIYYDRWGKGRGRVSGVRPVIFLRWVLGARTLSQPGKDESSWGRPLKTNKGGRAVSTERENNRTRFVDEFQETMTTATEVRGCPHRVGLSSLSLSSTMKDAARESVPAR